MIIVWEDVRSTQMKNKITKVTSFYKYRIILISMRHVIFYAEFIA